MTTLGGAQHILVDSTWRLYGYVALCGARVTVQTAEAARHYGAAPCAVCLARAALMRLGVRFVACEDCLVRFAALDSAAPCRYCEGQGVFPCGARDAS